MELDKFITHVLTDISNGVEQVQLDNLVSAKINPALGPTFYEKAGMTTTAEGVYVVRPFGTI